MFTGGIHFRTSLSGDVHWGYGILTHGHTNKWRYGFTYSCMHPCVKSHAKSQCCNRNKKDCTLFVLTSKLTFAGPLRKKTVQTRSPNVMFHVNWREDILRDGIIERLIYGSAMRTACLDPALSSIGEIVHTLTCIKSHTKHLHTTHTMY